QHQRRRNNLRQRARSRNHARSQSTVVTITQHNRQRDETHRDDRSRHHAGRGGQHRTHDHNRNGQTTSHGAKQLPDGFKQVFGHARSFENQAHKGKEGNGQQGVVGNNSND